jgi:predicted CoA-binding protein
MASKRAIASFLACRRIAVVGVSRDPKDFSRAVCRAFAENGYDVVPVNANGGTIDGRQAPRSIGEVRPPVQAVLVMTPAAASAGVVRECADAGVARVWLYRAAGTGAASPEAVSEARARGMDLVDGACPFMFLPRASFFHRVHGFFHRLGGHVEA